jgi:ATP-dependent Zn protease
MRKALYIAGAILFVIVVVVVFFRPTNERAFPQQPISTVITEAKAGDVYSITERGDRLEVTLTYGPTYESRKEEGVSIYTLLDSNGVDASSILIDVKNPSEFNGWFGLLLNFLPVIFFVTLIYVVVRALNRVSRQ